jgi:hypothetical protein
VTFAGRFPGVFLACVVEAATVAGVGLVVSVATAAGAAEFPVGLDTPTSAGFGDCLEHALTASSAARIAKLATIASFCWRDQDEDEDESVVPETVLFVAWLADSRLTDF